MGLILKFLIIAYLFKVGQMPAVRAVGTGCGLFVPLYSRSSVSLSPDRSAKPKTTIVS